MDNVRRAIIFYGYYDDFAHFFSKVLQDITARADATTGVFVTGYMSGWLAWRRLAPSMPAELLAIRVARLTIWYKIRYFKRIPHSVFRKYRPKWLLEYEFRRTGRYPDLHALLARIHVIDDLFRQYRPAYAVISGDARVSARIVMAAAHRYGCATGFFEQGPFGTTFLDPAGVNANLTVPQREDSAGGGTGSPLQVDAARVPPERRPPWLRATDFALSCLPGWPSEYRSRLPLNTFLHTFLQTLRRRTPPAAKPNSAPPAPVQAGREILFALQVPDDANFIMHSRFYDFEAALRLVAGALPEGALLAVREHPKFRGGYGKECYQFVDRHPQLYLQRDLSVQDAFSRCTCVITINSMLGLEALVYKVPVFLLGRSYYESVCTQAKDLHNAHRQLQAFMAAPHTFMDWPAVTNALSVLFREVALPGHFRDSGGAAARTFADRIFASMPKD